MSTKGFWSCPVCGRQFRNINQWHSHEVYPVEHHFREKPPRLKEIFDHMAEKIGEFGPVRIDAVQTGINFAARSHFAMAAVQKNSIKLELLLDRDLHSPRVTRTQRLTHPRSKSSQNRGVYVHEIKLEDKKDIDIELVEWLREAYQLKSR